MNDRHEKIHKILDKHGSVSVEQLKKELFASEATIRRDLKQMEQQGLLIRIWGGALSTSNKNNDPPLFVRSNANVNAKNAIAKVAVDFLQDNMTIFLASGTTVTKLANFFYKYDNLTVLTNNLNIISTLNNHFSAKIIILGGELYENCDMVGSLTENMIEQFNADLFFFSCSGITADGFSSVDMTRLNIIKKMKKYSAKIILLVDTSKVGKKYIYNGFGFEDIDYVVMETIPDDMALRKALGKKLITPKNVKTSKKQSFIL